jgi:hypothetical protein
MVEVPLSHLSCDCVRTDRLAVGRVSTHCHWAMEHGRGNLSVFRPGLSVIDARATQTATVQVIEEVFAKQGRTV